MQIRDVYDEMPAKVFVNLWHKAGKKVFKTRGKRKLRTRRQRRTFFNEQIAKKILAREGVKTWSPEYLAHIQSPEWRIFRLKIFVQRGRKCERCDSKERLQLHHKTYERLGHELPRDVEILCKICHDMEHGQRLSR